MFKQVRITLIALLAVLAFGANQAFADSRLVDGLYYIFDEGTKTATVTYPTPDAPTAGSNTYTGAIVVPADVYDSYSGYEYKVTKIGDQAFRYSTVTSLTLSEGIVSCGTSSFNNMTEIEELVFPNSFTTIGGGDPLCGCTKLTKVTFGKGMAQVGQGFCFSGTILTDLYCLGSTPANIGGYFMAGCADATIHVLETAGAAYASKWASIGWGSAPVISADIEAEMTYEDFQKVVAVYEAYDVKASDAPGCLPEADAAAYIAALEAARSMSASATDAEFKAASNALATEYAKVATITPNPITEGYYYLVNNSATYKANFGAYPAMYLTPSAKYANGASAVFYAKFDENNPNFIFKLTPKEGKDDYWYVQNAVNGWYLNTGNGDDWYGESTICSETPVNAQWFRAKGAGAGTFWVADETDDRVSRVVRATETGTVYGWTTYADVPSDAQKGYNTWSLIPVDEETVNSLVETYNAGLEAKAAAQEAMRQYYNATADLRTALAENEEISEEAKAAIDEAGTAIVDLWNGRGSDITSAPAVYEAAVANLKAALNAVVGDAVEVDGIKYILDHATKTAKVTYKEETEATKAGENSYEGDIEIPATITVYGVDYTVNEIGKGAFIWSNITTMKLPETITTVGQGAFARCTKLTELNVPDAMTYLPMDFAAYDTQLRSIVIGEGITEFKQGPFYGSGNLKNITFKGVVAPVHGNYTFGVTTKPTVHITELADALGQFAAWDLVGVNYGVGTIVADYEKEYTAKDLEAAIAVVEATEYTIGVGPGYNDAEAVEALNAKVAELKGAEVEDVNAAVAELIPLMKAAQVTPITEGLYQIVTAGNGPGYSGGPYNYEMKKALYIDEDGNLAWQPYEMAKATQVFKLTAAEGGWYAQNYDNNKYIGKGASTYACNISTTDEAENPQVFTWVKPGKYAITWNGNPYVYTMASNHNGSNEESGKVSVWGSAAEAKNFGVNVWYVLPVTEAMVENAELLASINNKVAEVAEALEEGVGTAPGFISPACVDSVKAYTDKALEVINSGDAEAITALAENFETEIEGLVVYNPLVDGKYYIVNASKTFQEKQGKDFAVIVTPTTAAEGNIVAWNALNKADERYVMDVKVLDEDGHVTIQSVQNGLYAGTSAENTYSQVMLASTEPVELLVLRHDQYGIGQFDIRTDENPYSWHPQGNGGGTGAGWDFSGNTGSGACFMVGWAASWSDASVWYFVPVTEEDQAAIDQAKVTNELAEALTEAAGELAKVVEYTQGEEGLIASDASNISTNAPSLDLTKLVNGNLSETTETWAQYPKERAYLQVDLTGKEVTDFYITYAPRQGARYYKEDAPKSWIITASEDGENWDYINEYPTDGDQLAEGALYTYPVVNLGKAYNFVRFTAPEAITNRTGYISHIAFGEFQLYAAEAQPIENEDFAAAANALKAQIATAQAAVTANNATAEGVATLQKASAGIEIAIEDSKVEGGYWQIATTASAPQAGKTYVLKNAFNGKILDVATGTVTTVDAFSNDQIWTIEASGNQAEENDTYYLKSVAANGYWQYVNYGEKTWDEETPYDGYDWYDYAGTNAEFGAKETAQELTILAGVADGTLRNGTNSEAKGYVLTAAEKIMDNYFKLGYQERDGVGNAAMEPWNGYVAWDFYEATWVNGVQAELAKALEIYSATVAAGTDPGFCTPETADAYNAALEAAKAINDESTKVETRQAIDDLKAAYAALEAVEITDGGLYYIVSAGKGSGYPFSDAVKYDEENKFALYNANGVVNWAAFDETNLAMVYQFTKQGDNWVVKSVADNTYINKGTGTYACDIQTSADVVTAQTFEPSAVAGKFTAKPAGNPYVYGLTSTHNGAGEKTEGKLSIWGSADEASRGKMNLWYIRNVNEDIAEKLELLGAAKVALATITPASHHDNTGNRSFLLGNEKTSVDGLATSKEALAALQAAYDAVEAGLNEGKKFDDLTEELAALDAAKAVVDAKSNPLTNGYYYLVAEFGDDTNNIPGGLVITENAEGLPVKSAYVENNEAQIFKAELDGEGKIYLQNVASKKYLGAVVEGKWTLVEEKTALNIQSGEKYNWYWGAPKNEAARSCSFILTNDESQAPRCSTTPDAQLVVYGVGDYSTYAWHVSWAFRPAEYTEPEPPVVEGGYWQIAEEASAPVAGKTYAIKNVTKANYLDSKKGLATVVNALANEQIWTLEATGAQAEGNDTYYLKSVAEDGYWIYNDYASQTWDETTPYDGYDWYNYAGINAEFVAQDAAEKFTVLAAVTDKTLRNGSDQEEAKGYVITAENKFLDNYFKLGQQGSDAALEPWNEDVAWEFYEATWVDDIQGELALALKAYDFDAENATTGTTPGYYDAEKIAAYTAALAAAKAITEESAAQDVREAIDNLADAFDGVGERNPIVAGYYYIASAGKGSGHPASDEIKYDEEKQFALYNKDGLVQWKMWDRGNYDEIYEFTADNNGNWIVKNIVDNTYINKGTGTYGCDILTSGEATTAQEFMDAAVAGKFTFKYDGNPYVYALTASHNGSKGATEGKLSIWGTAGEADNCKMNYWFLIPARDADVEAAQKKAAEGAAKKLNSLIAQYEGEEFPEEVIPGYPTEAAQTTFASELADAKDVAENGTVEEIMQAVNDLQAAHETLLATVNPLVDGYYYIVCDNANIAANDKAKKAMFINTEKNVVSWGELKEGWDTYVFQVTVNATNGTISIKNVENGLYTGASTEFCGSAAASETAVDVEATCYGEGSYLLKAGGWTYCPKGNPSGEADGPNDVWGYNGTPSAHAEWMWSFIPTQATGVNDIAAAGAGVGVTAGKGGVTVTSDKAQTVKVVSAAGVLVSSKNVEAGETITINLVPGIYIVNGKKVLVK